MSQRRTCIIAVLLFFLIIGIAATSFASDDKLELTATASSIYSSYCPASKAIDGNKNTYWVGARNKEHWWIKLDVGEEMELKRIDFSWYYNCYGRDFDIQISNDGYAWEDLYTDLSGSYNGTESHVLSGKARYVRIHIHTVYIFPMIREIEIYGSKSTPIQKKIRFQGKLKDSEESDIEGDTVLTFSIYNVETEGIALWSESQVVSVKSGIVDVVLGTVEGIDLPFNEQYYLGIKVESDDEMTPRFEMTSVPYAINTGKE